MSEILVIEDHRVLARNVVRALESAGHTVRHAASGAEGLASARTEPPDLVLLDLRLPDGSGLDVLGRIRDHDPASRVILMTAFASVPDAVEAMRRGAIDYLQKPLDLEELKRLVEGVFTRERLDRELRYLRGRDQTIPGGVVGESPGLAEIFAQVERLRDAGIAAGRRPTILLTGESGTGKGVVARAIHELLGGGPLIDVNCTAMPAPLVEAELFGHERGTFTDAKESRSGLFEAAQGGTLFLDEIGHLPLEIQTKFLKAIEEKRIRRLGSDRDRAVDVHIIAATNRDLDEAVRRGEFRADLLYRLRVLSFEIPPLRERGHDIALLGQHFCRVIGQQYGGEDRKLSAEAEAELSRYPWPGNVRELRNVIERAVLLSSEAELTGRTLATVLGRNPRREPETVCCLPPGGLDFEKLEQSLLVQALVQAGGNRTRAAKLLRLTRDTFRYRLQKFGIAQSDGSD